MSKTILANVDGFTPVIDDLAKQHGLVTAAVFGRMWRYCQMSDGVCKASLERISNDLGIDRATVLRHAQKLVEENYLEDTTPELRNRPHIYKDTGKAGLSIKIGVAQSNVTVAQRNTGVAERNVTVAESQLKKGYKKESKKQNKEIRGANAPDPRSSHPAIMAVREVMNKYPSKDVYDLLIRVLGETPNLADLRAAFEAWRAKGWRADNYGWVTEWYVSGIPDLHSRNGIMKNLPNGHGAMDRVLERIGQNGNTP